MKLQHIVFFSAVAAVAFADPGFATFEYRTFPGFYPSNGLLYRTSGIPFPYFYRSAFRPPVAISSSVFDAPAVVEFHPRYQPQEELDQSVYWNSDPFQSHEIIPGGGGNKLESIDHLGPFGEVFKPENAVDDSGYGVICDSLQAGASDGPEPMPDTPEVVDARAADSAASTPLPALNGEDVDARAADLPTSTPASTSSA